MTYISPMLMSHHKPFLKFGNKNFYSLPNFSITKEKVLFGARKPISPNKAAHKELLAERVSQDIEFQKLDHNFEESKKPKKLAEEEAEKANLRHSLLFQTTPRPTEQEFKDARNAASLAEKALETATTNYRDAFGAREKRRAQISSEIYATNPELGVQRVAKAKFRVKPVPNLTQAQFDQQYSKALYTSEETGKIIANLVENHWLQIESLIGHQDLRKGYKKTRPTNYGANEFTRGSQSASEANRELLERYITTSLSLRKAGTQKDLLARDYPELLKDFKKRNP